MVEVADKCVACGTVIRANAVFCHHCGRPLAPQAKPVVAEPPPVAGKPDLSATDPSLKTDAAVNPLPQPAAAPRGAEPLASFERFDDSNNRIDKASVAIAATNQNDAASRPNGSLATDNSRNESAAIPIKRRTKRYVSRTEYVWEAAETPSWRILLLAVLILVLVAVLVWLSNLLR